MDSDDDSRQKIALGIVWIIVGIVIIALLILASYLSITGNRVSSGPVFLNKHVIVQPANKVPGK